MRCDRRLWAASALPHGSLRCGWTVPAAPRLRRLSTGFAGLGVLWSNISPSTATRQSARVAATFRQNPLLHFRSAHCIEQLIHERKSLGGVAAFQALLFLFEIDWQDLDESTCDPAGIVVIALQRFV